MDLPSPEQIDAIGRAIGYAVGPIAAGVLAYFQGQCRKSLKETKVELEQASKDLNEAWGKIRELQGNPPGQIRQKTRSNHGETNDQSARPDSGLKDVV